MTINVYNGSTSSWEQTSLRGGPIFKYDGSDWLDAYLPNGLLAYYSFESIHTNSGTAVDGSGNGNDGTINGPTTGATGAVGSAISYDGTDDSVSAGTFSVSSSGFTISAWLFPDTLTSISQITYLGDGGTPAVSLMLNNSDIVFNNRLSDGGYGIWAGLASETVPTGQWSHLCGVVESSGDWVAYLDGTEVARYNTSTTDYSFTGSTNRIGSNPDYSRYFDGRLDEIRFYDRALSAAEVTALADHGRPL